jgi:hypothetical protein
MRFSYVVAIAFNNPAWILDSTTMLASDVAETLLARTAFTLSPPLL